MLGLIQVTAGADQWAAGQPHDTPTAHAVRYPDGEEERFGVGPPAFVIAARSREHFQRILHMDAYAAAMAFIRGEFDVSGDLVAAVRFQRSISRVRWTTVLHASAAWLAPGRVETWFQSRGRAAQNIRYHYDRSNEFYAQFLDRRMVYSCGYFGAPETSLDEAQLAKLDHVCRKLDLQPDERFLDVGCGWGALLIHAAERYGVRATGCTLSAKQAAYARAAAEQALPSANIVVNEADFRDVSGRFDKIASVGMFEHVGRHRLRSYLRTVYELLAPGGLFLNHGIVRPAFVSDGPDTLFLQRRVFPGGELVHLADIVRAAEVVGFEVLDVEDLRPHYALTCRAWVRRLQQNADACLRTTEPGTYRTWLLYLAGAAHGFESGMTSVCQVLLAKRNAQRPHLSREYMCRSGRC